MQKAKREGTLWYQAKADFPNKTEIISVQLLSIPPAGGFAAKPSLSVFNHSRACLFFYGGSPYLRIELEPARHKRQRKFPFPQSTVVNLETYGWKVKDLAILPVSVTFDRVIFREPVELALDTESVYLFKEEPVTEPEMMINPAPQALLEKEACADEMEITRYQRYKEMAEQLGRLLLEEERLEESKKKARLNSKK
ncbi:M protein [Nyavirus gerbillisci]|uniref:M protein n=1 Tax=Toure nyavirus TaxID=2994001 RepID=A0A9E8DAK9_9MONO|nr:M protein [Toure nyavirus]